MAAYPGNFLLFLEIKVSQRSKTNKTKHFGELFSKCAIKENFTLKNSFGQPVVGQVE